ncbi:response regulator [Tropicimonas sp.]|uniref:response regulator n=1 Tax=Tropicimonas sp. TaxID=2067044 RepID=UPI003A869D2B
MRVLVADDHDLLRDTLTLWFQREDIDVASTGNLAETEVAIAASEPFDLILLDYRMPGMKGLEGLRTVLGKAKGARVALMSGIATRHEAEQALAMGASGFLPKTLPAKTLVNAVRFMAAGEVYAPVSLMESSPMEVERDSLREKLSPQELRVLEQLSVGKANKEIARELDVHEATVKLHVRSVYRKLGVQNRTQAALLAREVGLFSDQTQG